MNRRISDIFERFAADFETTLRDDDWSRLQDYFTPDATYHNVGSPDPVCHGPRAILRYLQQDVTKHDRRFDTRTLVALSPPVTDGERLSRRWRCTYTLAGAPDLVVEGEARYRFDDGRIAAIEEEVTAASLARVEAWMQSYAHRLPT